MRSGVIDLWKQVAPCVLTLETMCRSQMAAASSQNAPLGQIARDLKPLPREVDTFGSPSMAISGFG